MEFYFVNHTISFSHLPFGLLHLQLNSQCGAVDNTLYSNLSFSEPMPTFTFIGHNQDLNVDLVNMEKQYADLCRKNFIIWIGV